MKYSLTILLLCLVWSNSLTAQSPEIFSGNTLWLKTEASKEFSSQLKSKDVASISRAHFNFNPIIGRETFTKAFRNIVSPQYSLFVVFKSDFEDERTVLQINRGKTNILITSKEVLHNKEMTYKLASDKGIILSYLNANNDKNGKKRNSLTIDDIFGQDEEGNEQLMELIYFPTILDGLNRKKIETYLSIKYGISILGDFDYLDSGAERIWDAKKNKAYNNRVTGIGRDEAFHLYQKQSGNAEKDGIYIGFGTVDTTNADNKYKIKDRSFLLWGDNAGRTTFRTDKNSSLKKMSRIWKMQVSGIQPKDSIKTQLKISKKELGYGTTLSGQEFLWLCINKSEAPEFDLTSSKYIRQSGEDNENIYFNDIAWDEDGSGADLFTFVQAPDFFIDYVYDFSCESSQGKIILKIEGGTPPYTVIINDNEFNTRDVSHTFTALMPGAYSLDVSEAKGKKETAALQLDPFTELNISLNPLWYIASPHQAVVTPSLGRENNGLYFEWLKGDRILSTAQEFVSSQAGTYNLRVHTPEGCTKDFPFAIENSPQDTFSRWQIYPNPVRKGEYFSIAFNLDKELPVTITINSLEGKQIMHKNLGTLKSLVFQDAINTQGVYLITATIGTKSETVKLIVR